MQLRERIFEVVKDAPSGLDYTHVSVGLSLGAIIA